MLEDAGHGLWADEGVVSGLDGRLGASRGAFVDAAMAVEGKLGALERFGLECVKKVEEGKMSEGGTSKEGNKSIRAKIKFAFSEPKIESLIGAVSRLTQEMQTLIQQTGSSTNSDSVSRPSVTTKRTIEKYNAIKGAAGNLYKALSCACTVHNEHVARLSLQAVHNDPSQIQFMLAMSSRLPTPDTSPLPCEPRLWLTVESVVSGTLRSAEPTPVSSDAGKPHKRQLDRNFGSDLADVLAQSAYREAKLPKTSQSVLPTPVALQTHPKVEPSDVLPNFCAKENFCAQLQKLASKSQTDKSLCVGYLALPFESRHLVYLNSTAHVATSSMPSPMIALTDLFKPEYQSQLSCYGLPPQDRVRIARQLAQAVLQFQATPWLENPWSSGNILMFEDFDSVSEMHAENHDLFLNAYVRKSLESSMQSKGIPNRCHIRNQLLFSLGVMMLEMAFQKPLAELRQAQDIDQNENLNTDYFTADRVRRQVSARMGPRYAEAARKCIHCDFGFDNDLNQIGLQESFYQNVVCELEVLEKLFHKFELSI